MSLFYKGSILMLAVLFAGAPRIALADAADGGVVTSKLYVDTVVGAITGLPSGTSNQVLQHNGTSWTATTMDSAPTASSNKPVTSGGVKTAVDAKQTKPASVADGKVLTYTGNDANTNVTAKYIQVPVATGDPNAATNPATPTALSSLWIQ